MPSTAATSWRLSLSKDDSDKDAQSGMDEAFRQLNSLDSLGDGPKGESTVKMDEQSKAQLSSAEEASLEEEVRLFKGMLQDSEQDASELYSDVMKEMGGTPKAEGMPKEKRDPEIYIQERSSGSIPRSEEDAQKFMDQAIQEALEEAKSMAPDGRKMSDSILDDEEIMKEIEEIFEKGNEKLLASLEEIRKEQQALAKASAEQRSKVAMDNMANDDTAERLAAAEASVEKQLSRVEKETVEVEKAMANLKRVQEQLDKEASGSMFKPAALAGVLLFSLRAVLDFVAMTGGGIDAEAHLTAALIQGAIALICAGILFFLK